MSDEATPAPEKALMIETATARDILAALAPDHAFPDQDPEDRAVYRLKNPDVELDVVGPILRRQHGVDDADEINESGAIIKCVCGEVVPFGPEDCQKVGLKAADVVKRLKDLSKFGLARVGKEKRE
jgi:hypothetical protein